MSSYKKIVQTKTDVSGITEHQIRLVPVEAIQQQADTSDDSDIEEVPSDEEEVVEEVEVQVIHHIEVPNTIPPPTTAANPSSSSNSANSSKEVHCMFCYKPVQKFSTNKTYKRRILNNTCQRLFKYICDHLDIEFARVPNRGLQKPPKETQLLPAYLPLCVKCRELYYNNIYESFVTYEDAVVRLADQIAACITRAIGISAKQNKQSVEDGQGAIATEDIFDAYEKSMNEHEVMRAVRQFRQKVVEKNPAGYIEEPETKKTGRGRPSKPENEQGDVIAGTSGTPTVDSSGDAVRVSPALKNVIKIVKNRTDILQRERTNEIVTNRLDVVKKEMDREISGGAGRVSEPEYITPDLNYYAVSNPAPGVIQIIPVVVGDNGETVPGSNHASQSKRKKRVRSQRENYQKQRIALNTCKFCNKYFPGHSSLVRHQVLKHGLEKPEKCPHCDYRGINKASLKSHLSTHLDGDDREKAKKYACHICGLKFKGKSGLTGHLRSHSGEKPFVCDICGKAFTSSTSKQLCLDKHNGVKHHKCTYCDKTFLRKEVLKIHERTHTGEKPFKCQVCGKAFAQRSPLNIHLRMHKKKDPTCVIKTE